ncbi:MAG: TldD/PmbA family protein, partial [Actinomycetota bacterium]
MTTEAAESASEMIPTEVLNEVLTAALGGGAEFAEVFAEDVSRGSVHLDDGRIESLASGRDRGAGIRVVAGESTGFAHTADLSRRGLLAAASAAADAARQSASGEARSVALDQTPTKPGPVEVRPAGIDKATKVELLQRVDEVARSRDAAISQVSARYADNRRRILVANSDGILSGDDQTRTLFSVNCVASGDAGLQTGSESIGLSIGWELFDRYDVEELARRAAERALTKLGARPAPSGTLPVVIGPGSGGVLFHEACG